MERRTVYFTGHVQGVGFRYAARNAARGFDVTGFVRNLDDGRVELIAEGNPQELDGFLAEIEARMGHHIRSVRTNSSQPTGEFIGFAIRF